MLKYIENYFPKEYTPRINDPTPLETVLIVDDCEVHLSVFDSQGQEDFREIRKIIYENTDVFMLCYSTISRNSLKNLENLWLEEVNTKRSGIPFVLVGLKTELRDNCKDSEKSRHFISAEEGKRTAERLGAYAHVECSTKAEVNLDKVFETVCRAAM